MVVAPTYTDETSAPPAEAAASFRFIGRDIDPEFISRQLKVEPSAVYSSSAEGAASHQRQRTNMWRLDSSIPATEPLVEHLDALLKVLLPVRESLRLLEKETGWSPCFYWGYFFESDQGGRVELPPRILGSIAYLGATLDLRVYSDHRE